MILQFLSVLLLWQSTTVPYRAKEDYIVELKYNFKARENTEKATVNWESHNAQGRDDRAKTGLLPYLVVNIKILNTKPEEIRFRCDNNRGRSLFNRKSGKEQSFDVDMGYIDDIKDHITANIYTLYALDVNRHELNRVELLVQDDGTFLVNGEKRGKF